MREIVLGLIVLNFSQAYAARPFVTDDARLTTSESCQVESWSRLYKNSTEIWALPACNPTGNFEITAGMGLAKPKDTATTQDYVIQAKSLARELATNDWGWAFGDNKSTPYWQTGFRYSIIPNLFQVDTTIGRQINGDLNTRWISFGLRYTPNSIF